MLKTLALGTSAILMTALPATAAEARSKSKSMRCAPVTTAQVEAQFDRFNAAWATRDPEKVTDLFSSDAVLLATVSNKPRTSPDEVQDYFETFLKSAPFGTINTSTISLGCNMASRLGTWTVTLTDAKSGVKTDVKARYSFIYKLDGKDWKIYHLHSSAMPEPVS